MKLVDEQVQELLLKGAIVKTKFSTDNFISNIFIVPKKNGKLRPVINLRFLNEFVEYHHFKQENLTFVLDLIQKNDFCTSVDLRDAYFSISIDPDFRKYLCFSWRGQFYSFRVLPFGLASAPRIFTKLLKPVFAWFRKQGIRCCYYIDDSLCTNQDYNCCEKEAQIMTNKLDNLGFVVNYEKSVLKPCQRIVFFGVIIDTVQFKVFLTDEKIEKIKKSCSMILEKSFVTIRTVASLIGLLVHAFNAVTHGPLHYRVLEREKTKYLRFNKQ